MKITKHTNKVVKTPLVVQKTLPLINEIGEPILDKYGKKTFVKQLEKSFSTKNTIFYDLEVDGETHLNVHEDILVNRFESYDVENSLYEYWTKHKLPSSKNK